jgi:hypothetical protein
MLESDLIEGLQDWIAGKPLTCEVSITDACIGWQDTIVVLDTFADAVRARSSAPEQADYAPCRSPGNGLLCRRHTLHAIATRWSTASLVSVRGTACEANR